MTVCVGIEHRYHIFILRDVQVDGGGSLEGEIFRCRAPHMLRAEVLDLDIPDLLKDFIRVRADTTKSRIGLFTIRDDGVLAGSLIVSTLDRTDLIEVKAGSAHTNVRKEQSILRVARFIAEIRSDDMDFADRNLMLLGIDAGVCRIDDTVDQVILVEADQTEIATTLDLAGLITLEIYERDLRGVIDVLRIRILVSDVLLRIRACEARLLQSCGDRDDLEAVRIDAVDAAAVIEIQESITGQVGELLEIPAYLIIYLRDRNEEVLRHCIIRAVIAVVQDTIISLMASPVHITVDDEIHIALIRYRQDLDVMLIIVCADAIIRIRAVAEDIHRMSALRRLIVAPEPLIRLKCDIMLIFRLLHGDIIRISDTERDPLAREILAVALEDLMCRPVEVHHVDPLRIISKDEVILIQEVLLLSVLIRHIRLVADLNLAHHAVKFLERHIEASLRLHPGLSPGDLVEA